MGQLTAKKYFLLFFVPSNLSKVELQISMSGYKYYTSYSLLKLLFKIHPLFGQVLCDVHCGSPESHYCLECSCRCRYLTKKQQLQGIATESGTSVRGTTSISKLYIKKYRIFRR